MMTPFSYLLLIILKSSMMESTFDASLKRVSHHQYQSPLQQLPNKKASSKSATGITIHKQSYLYS